MYPSNLWTDTREGNRENKGFHSETVDCLASVFDIVLSLNTVCRNTSSELQNAISQQKCVLC
jgi:hypothetical protein